LVTNHDIDSSVANIFANQLGGTQQNGPARRVRYALMMLRHGGVSQLPPRAVYPNLGIVCKGKPRRDPL